MEEGKNIYWEHLLVFAIVGQSGFGETRKMSICGGLGGDGGLGQGGSLQAREWNRFKDMCEPELTRLGERLDMGVKNRTGCAECDP